MKPCDASIFMNVGGIALEVWGVLIVILHDWQREQERKHRNGRQFVEALAVTAHATVSANDALVVTGTTSGYKGQRTEEQRRLDDLERELKKQREEAQEQNACWRAAQHSL